ncbi:MAG: M20 family metallopeptidase [Bacteroidetes bacterium]|nr:M20 family metallopeptidase [Bacteroidota bacterium]
MTDNILSLSRKVFPEIVRLRRHLHQYPELAFEEFDTGKTIASELDKLEIRVKKGVGKTGLVGILKGNASAGVVALRADMDALPITEESGLGFTSRSSGRMHACGHDAHMAMLVGAAMILSQLKKDVNGTVKFLFQPSEEKNPGGAPAMLKDGALSNPDADVIFGQHVTNELAAGKFGFRPGPIMASADEIYITVMGKGGHGAKPHETVDPVVIAARIVDSLQSVISRMRDPLDPSVLTIGSIHGGTAPNIIPDKVELAATLRTMNEKWRRRAHELITRTASETAKAFGGKCKTEISHGYPVLVNSDQETLLARNALTRLYGKSSAMTVPPVMGAEDFAYYLQKVPGTFWWIGTGNKKTGATASIHNAKFRIDESSLMYGAAFLAFLTIEYLRQRDRES